MTEKIKGQVTKVSNKNGRYGIEIGNGNWYNGFGETPCNKGDIVELTYEINDQWKNVQTLEVVEKAPEIQKVDNVEEPMERMNKNKTETALRVCAMETARSLGETKEEIYKLYEETLQKLKE